MPILFAATLFFSAFLLFSIEPLIGKILLPLLGGVPAVWTVCMSFFQLVLLAGYLVSHATTLAGRRFARGRVVPEALLLLGAMLLALYILPSRPAPPSSALAAPAAWTFRTLTSMIGGPFLLLSMTAPMLQRWFSESRHRRAGDPYFLYAASNAGSLLALIAYPVVIEPHLRLSQQLLIWNTCYVVLVAFIAVCAVLRALRPSDTTARLGFQAAGPETPVTWKLRTQWLLLSLAPASLLMGVTSYITTDIASAPLFWSLPLTLYLGTFVVAFTPRLQPRLKLLQLASKVLAMGAGLELIGIILDTAQPQWLFVGLHLLVFVAATLLCHVKLAAMRPPPRQLTEYFAWIAMGGACAGIFNGVLAPLIFPTVAEYPLMLILACLLRPRDSLADPTVESLMAHRRHELRYWSPVVASGLVIAIGSPILRKFGLTSVAPAIFLVVALPLFFSHLLRDDRLRHAASLAFYFVAASALFHGSADELLHRRRSFYGTLKVLRDSKPPSHVLMHGTTQHGRQLLDPNQREEPISYYSRLGPAGQVFDTFRVHFHGGPLSPRPEVGIVGLGTGELTAYSRGVESWSLFELNPGVLEVASNPTYFSYLAGAQAGSMKFILGDARLMLQNESDGKFSLLLIDAFNSDSIPTHLLTQEAFALYQKKLKTNGILAFHISSRFFDLNPVIADLAETAGYLSYLRNDVGDVSRIPSDWMLLSRSALSEIDSDKRWTRVQGVAARAWTDDYGSLLRTIRW